jgi:ubiquinone/menaquinone biosynthesis C-methylase UbiE
MIKAISKLKRNEFVETVVDSTVRKTKCPRLNILDVGCGRGDVEFALANKGHNILGIDLNKNEIAVAIKKNKYINLTFKKLDAFDIDQLGKKFDVVICSEILEHVDAPQIICNKLASACTFSGFLIITLPNGFGPYELFYETPRKFLRKFFVKLGLSKDYKIGEEHRINFTVGRIKELLGNAGFDVVHFSNSDFFSFLPYLRESKLARFDCRIADNLPNFMASGWFLVCELHKQSR